jgi:undecaprenyl-diphosphatase
MNTVIAYLAGSDVRLARRLRAWTPPGWIRLWMVASTRLGDGYHWACAILILLLAGRQELPVLGAAAVAAGLANGSIMILKKHVRRYRPAACEPHPAFGRRHSQWFAFDEFSFPSGHALNAFTLAGFMGLYAPLLAPLFALLAVSIGASRIVIGLHFLTDVIVGAGIGLTIGAGVYWAFFL